MSSTLGAEEVQNDAIVRLLKQTEAIKQSQQEHRKEAKANKEIIKALQKEESWMDNTDLDDIMKKTENLMKKNKEVEAWKTGLMKGSNRS